MNKEIQTTRYLYDAVAAVQIVALVGFLLNNNYVLAVLTAATAGSILFVASSIERRERNKTKS